MLNADAMITNDHRSSCAHLPDIGDRTPNRTPHAGDFIFGPMLLCSALDRQKISSVTEFMFHAVLTTLHKHTYTYTY